MDKRSITAWLLGCKPEELKSFSDYRDYVAVVGPDGRKSYFDNAQLIKGEKAMALDLTPGPSPETDVSREGSKTPAKKRTKKAS